MNARTPITKESRHVPSWIRLPRSPRPPRAGHRSRRGARDRDRGHIPGIYQLRRTARAKPARIRSEKPAYPKIAFSFGDSGPGSIGWIVPRSLVDPGRSLTRSAGPGGSLASVEAVPSLDPGPPASVHGHPPLPPAPTPHRPAPTTRHPASVATPPPARTAPKRPAPPRNEVAVPPPASSPTPQAPPQARSAPEPDRRADPPPAISGGADPCATFHDFRREPCYAYLNRLTH